MGHQWPYAINYKYTQPGGGARDPPISVNCPQILPNVPKMFKAQMAQTVFQNVLQTDLHSIQVCPKFLLGLSPTNKNGVPGLARKTEIRRSCQTLALKCFCIRSLLPWNLVELWTTSLTAVSTCVPFALTLQLLYNTNHSTSNHDVCITVLYTNTSIALSTQL